LCIHSVALHKTADSSGAATLAVDEREAKMLGQYMRFRNLDCFKKAAPFVFINRSGTQMNQSGVTSALTAAFKGSGYGHRISCTKVRKATVTAIHSRFPENKQTVANHMCHRVATAEKHYWHVEKQKNSIQCTKLIRGVMTSQPETYVYFVAL